jgi:hypothetical protein
MKLPTRIFLASFLPVGLLFLSSIASAVPVDSSIVRLEREFSGLNRVESELVGPLQTRSRGWAVTDSLTSALGNDAAIQFFHGQLNASEPALRYYAVIGIVMAGGSESEALDSVKDAQVLCQTGCLMRNQSLKATVAQALRDRSRD